MNWIIRMRGLAAFALMVVAFLGNESIASGQLNLIGDGWHTWRAPAVEQAADLCCFRWTGAVARKRTCDLDRSRGNYDAIDGYSNYSGEVQIYALMQSGIPIKVTVLSPQCSVSTDTKINDHGLLDQDVSISWLRPYIKPRSRISSDVLHAISAHGGDRSLKVVVAVVESNNDGSLLSEAIFWLVQSDSDAAFEYIGRLLTGT